MSKRTTTDTPAPEPVAPVRRRRSPTSVAVVDRLPEEAERLAAAQTPATSERIMGLEDSPKAAETGQGR